MLRDEQSKEFNLELCRAKEIFEKKRAKFPTMK